MNDEDILHNLESLAGRLSVEVKYMNLDDEDVKIQSGTCNLKGKEVIIIDRRLSAKEKGSILSLHLRKYNTDDIFIPPFLRDRLNI